MSYYRGGRGEREIDQSLIPIFTASIIVSYIYINNLLKAFFYSIFHMYRFHISLMSPHWINNLINIYSIDIYIYIYMYMCVYVHLFHKEYQPITCKSICITSFYFPYLQYSLLYCLQSEFLTNKTKNIHFIYSFYLYPCIFLVFYVQNNHAQQ